MMKANYFNLFKVIQNQKNDILESDQQFKLANITIIRLKFIDIRT